MFKTLLPLAIVALFTASTASPLDVRAVSTTSTSPFPTFPPYTGSAADIKALQEALILAPSEVDRQQILLPNPPDSTNITYQFVNVTHSAPTGGEIVLASVDKFPALVGTSGRLFLFALLSHHNLCSWLNICGGLGFCLTQ